MIKLDDAISMTIATQQRSLADHASRNWQAALEREWLGAWPAPTPSVPQRGSSDGAPQLSPEAPAFLVAIPDGAASAQPEPSSAKLSQPATAGAESLTTAPSRTSASSTSTLTSAAKPAATTPGTEHTAVPSTTGTVSGERQVAATAMALMTASASQAPAAAQNVWGAAVYAASSTHQSFGNLPPNATTVGAGRIEALPPAQATSLVTAFGVAQPQADSAEAELPASAARSAKAGLGNMPQWESALRLASPEEGKVQAVLRDASLSQEAAHHVAMNLSGTLANMGFEAIRIYVNGKQYGANKDNPTPMRSVRPGTTTPTVPLVSKVKE